MKTVDYYKEMAEHNKNVLEVLGLEEPPEPLIEIEQCTTTSS